MVKEREYLLSVNAFNEPEVLEGKPAIAMLVMRLILLNPGSDPLHPDMGVGIEKYRFAMGRLEELKTRVKEQINTYLPFTASVVDIEITEDHLCDVLITIEDTIYRYSSSEAPIPITIDSVNEVI